MKFLCLLALLASAAFGQYSLVLPTTGSVTNASVPANSGICIYEGDANVTASGSLEIVRYTASNCQIDIAVSGTNIQAGPGFAIGGTGPCVGNPITFETSQLSSTYFKFRAAKDDAGKIFYFDIWDGLTGTLLQNIHQNVAPNNICTYSAVSSPSYVNGITFGDSSSGIAFTSDFFREIDTWIPEGSQIPLTASTASYQFQWKFDQSNADASGNGYSWTPSNIPCVANACYTSSATVEALILSVPQVCQTAYAGAPAKPTWSAWISLKVGVVNCLDGTLSYSQTYQSAVVTYAWTQTAGASAAPSSGSAGQPTVTPPSFGSYTYHLVVTDMNSQTNAADLALGAVVMDSAGVVQMPGLAGHVFGQQIAFGRNPWSYYDQQNQYAVCQMVTATGCAGWFNSNYDKTWAMLGTGSIAYNFAGIGFAPGPSCTTLAVGINATATTITVANAGCLDLSGLPTTPVWILVGTSLSAFEMVRICSAVANVLTVCYDGRGMSGNTSFDSSGNPVAIRGGYPSPGAAASWSMGALVGQMRINGTSTLFGTDSVRPVCPAGLPGPPGPVVYSTGTVTFTGSSATVVGSGTTFTAGMVGGYIRVAATHASGTPFVFWRQISAFTDATHLTMDHAAPVDIDGTAFSFKITGIIYLMLQGNATDTHVFNTMTNGMGCESDTSMYAVPTHDVPAYDSTAMPTTGTVGYSYKTALWFTTSGTTTPNFYGVGLMGLLYYYRSGDPLGLALSNQINPYATRDPEMADGIAPIGNSVLTEGGPVIGTMACLVTGDCPTLVEQNLNSAGLWSQVEPYAVQGEIGSEGCNADDTRDTGYETSWLTMAANWDTNTMTRADFTAALGTNSPSVLSRDQGCIRTLGQGYSAAVAGSFANGFVWAPLCHSSSPCVQDSFALTGTPSPSRVMTANAGTTITGWSTSTPTTPATCYGIDEGTLTVTHGLSTATIATVTTNSGTMTPQVQGGVAPNFYPWSGNSPTMIWFNDGSQDGVLEYTFSGTTVQLSGVWTGASGTYGFMTTGGGALVNGGQTIGGLGAIGVDNTDDLAHNTLLTQSWACRQTSGTTANLFKVWPGTTGSYSLSYYNVQAFGQQPFMLGVKSIQINWAKYNSNSTVVSGYAAMQAPVGNWFQTYAWDQTNTKGTAYDTIGSACGAITDVAAGSFASIHSYEGCAPFGLASGSASIARSDSAEGANAMVLAFIANPSSATRNNLASFYGAIYGAPGTCAASVYSTCDGTFAAQLLTLDGAKWPGFFFGTGGLAGGSIPALLVENQGNEIFGPVGVFGPVFIAEEVP